MRFLLVHDRFISIDYRAHMHTHARNRHAHTRLARRDPITYSGNISLTWPVERRIHVWGGSIHFQRCIHPQPCLSFTCFLSVWCTISPLIYQPQFFSHFSLWILSAHCVSRVSNQNYNLCLTLCVYHLQSVWLVFIKHAAVVSRWCQYCWFCF